MFIGGAEGDRTPDLDIANVALSQLSYGPDAARTMGAGAGFCQDLAATSGADPAPALARREASR